MSDFLKDLANRYFQPLRPRLDDARRSVVGLADPRAAWHKLAEQGVIPSSFVDGTRRFAASSEVALAPDTLEVKSGQIFDHPPTMTAVLTHAADPDGMIAAEQALTEFYARLVPWNVDVPTVKQWLCASADHPNPGTFNGAYVTALDSLDATLEEAGHKLEEWLPPEALALPAIARRVVSADGGWRYASTHHLPVSRACWPPQLLAEKSFSEIANPFESLITLWLTGYLLDTGEQANDVWLVAQSI